MNLRPFSLVLPLAVLALAGCNLPIEPAKPDAVRYFVLSGTKPAPAAAGIEVRPVQLPAYLLSRVMVVRLSDHEVHFTEDAHWAESLDAGLTARLRERLQPANSASGQKDYAVRVQLHQCEGLAAGGSDAVRLTATFELVSLADDSVAIRQDFTARPRAWDGRDYGQLARQIGEATDELADAVAAALPKK